MTTHSDATLLIGHSTGAIDDFINTVHIISHGFIPKERLAERLPGNLDIASPTALFRFLAELGREIDPRQARCGDNAIELTTGPMFGGKTKSLITSFIAEKERALCIHPECLATNGRARHYILSHNGVQMPSMTYPARAADGPENLIRVIRKIHAKVLFIDEVQFIDDIVEIVKLCIMNRIYVKMFGLNSDFRQQMFPNIIAVMPFVTNHSVLSGKCSRCDRRSHYSVRIDSTNREIVDIGGADKYEAVCNRHLLTTT